MLPVISGRLPEAKPKKGKITCLTCNLKGCVGRCRFQSVECSQPRKAA
jgi:hypothetical protein